MKMTVEIIPNVTIYDNGAAYCICVNGIIAHTCNSLGNAWRHIEWMYKIAQQKFTVGEKEEPVTEWLKRMKMYGYMD
jgi:hypothetical protein